MNNTGSDQQNSAQAAGISLKLKVGIFFLPWLFAWFTLKNGVSTTARVVSFGWMAFVLIVASVGETTNEGGNPALQNQAATSNATDGADAGTPQPAKPKVEVKKISSYDLYAEYERNEIAADNKYKGSYLEVTGLIDDLGKDFLDNTYVMLNGTGFLGIQAYFPQHRSDVVANLSKNQEITVVCKVTGLMGSVQCQDAVLVK